MRGQASVEFTLLLTFLFLIFVTTYIVLGERMIHINQQKRDERVMEIQKTIIDEIKLAQSVENGYKRPFYLPRQIMGKPYTIEIVNHTALIISIDNGSYAYGLPTFVMGGFCMNNTGGAYYNLSISRESDIVSLSSCYNCTYSYAWCANAQKMGLCGDIDTWFPGSLDVCRKGHCKCLP